MPRPRPLTPNEASRTLANRLGVRLAPRIRQLATKFGLRSKRVFLVWTRFAGPERGDGDERLLARLELLPTPRVIDMSTVVFNPYSAGTLPVGTLRVDKIAVTYTADQLMGKAVPGQPRGAKIEEPTDFFWEVVEDGRGDNPPMRGRYRLMAQPDRREGDVCWSVLLERMSEDMDRQGRSQYGIDPDDR
ncbi:MAG TPA: hypothetical protein PKI27_00665 [Dermatophilaceae bacterium]|jgi:hypothetical protein|nr:hypothetical protein [Dermatophilaceae bacterium]